MFAPLCGLDVQISSLLPGRYGPRVIVSGADLTGVHLLQKQQRPRGVSPYHIGGAGLFPDEALIRSLGETVERYCQLLAEVTRGEEVRVCTHEELESGEGRLIDDRALHFFTKEQFDNDAFIFQPYASDKPLGWIQAPSLIDGKQVWVPAQSILLGYAAKCDRGEPRIIAGVTTGGAAHTVPELALRNALLEAIQLDAAMGHWCASGRSHRIEFDQRTEPVARVLRRSLPPNGPVATFYWLPSADLPGHTVVCVLGERKGYTPSSSVGIGCELRLNRSMYKAYIEAAGVFGLGKVTLLESATDESSDRWVDAEIDPSNIFDLDANVAYYALPETKDALMARYESGSPMAASDLPPDITVDPSTEIRILVDAFDSTGKELVALDLSTVDCIQLGLRVIRVWSPELLPLTMPSAPMLAHPRLGDYGSGRDSQPHPYA
ncbi:YcaO-like family protein [Nocardia sp. NPDC051570]|uniref:YcaO-like family protein n=1 Tax=Nocardia sp. NPDC051570 TaxID=3364324 RepID=UPI0037915782